MAATKTKTKTKTAEAKATPYMTKLQAEVLANAIGGRTAAQIAHDLTIIGIKNTARKDSTWSALSVSNMMVTMRDSGWATISTPVVGSPTVWIPTDSGLDEARKHVPWIAAPAALTKSTTPPKAPPTTPAPITLEEARNRANAASIMASILFQAEVSIDRVLDLDDDAWRLILMSAKAQVDWTPSRGMNYRPSDATKVAIMASMIGMVAACESAKTLVQGAVEKS